MLSSINLQSHTFVMQKIFVLIAFTLWCYVCGAQNRPVVADAETHQPLPSASVFDRKGNFAGVCDTKGRLPVLGTADFPVTVRCLGFNDAVINAGDIDTVFMSEYVTVLPEVVIESKKHNLLHMLAYVREYSTLSTMTDTVTLFREKMVDFMKPVTKTKFKGWATPRVLNARSFYRFTNNQKLDSVSDRCSHHFSWTDWMGLAPSADLPSALSDKEFATDTVFGKYSVTELWHKNNDRITLDLDILADTASRKWVPNLSSFFHKDIDFERFNARYNFDNVVGKSIDEKSLTGYSFTIESNGRGRGMFMFNRVDEQFYVTTYCEVYIIEKEYITEKEGRRWEKAGIGTQDVGFYIPAEAPELQPSVLALIERVNMLDHDVVRLSSIPDISNIGYRAERLSPGQQVLRRLKGLFGIDKMIATRKWNKNYNTFRQEQQKRNRKDNQ